MYKLLLLILAAFMLIGCGTMRVRQTKYFSIHNGTDKNYYRLRIKAKSVLGDAEFRSGWYPTESVDMLFGDISEESETNYIQTKQAIQIDINNAIKNTYKLWLDSASKPDISDDVLLRIMKARKRILAYPNSAPPFNDSYEIEYNAAKGIAIKHLDEKMVLILSSNPDEVIGKIVNFSESKKTTEVIDMLASTILDGKKMELLGKSTIQIQQDSIIKKHLNQTLKALVGKTQLDQDSEQNIQVLLNLLKQ